MSTLYIRDVPDAVAATLKQRAADRGQSLSAYVNEELQALAARPSNAEVVARLRLLERGQGPTTGEILEQVRASRP